MKIEICEAISIVSKSEWRVKEILRTPQTIVTLKGDDIEGSALVSEIQFSDMKKLMDSHAKNPLYKFFETATGGVVVKYAPPTIPNADDAMAKFGDVGDFDGSR